MAEDYITAIEEKLKELMSDDNTPRDVLSLAQDLRQEYPKEFKNFTSKMAEKYKLSICGAHHVHINGLLTILDRWAEEGKVSKTIEKGTILWQKK